MGKSYLFEVSERQRLASSELAWVGVDCLRTFAKGLVSDLAGFDGGPFMGMIAK